MLVNDADILERLGLNPDRPAIRLAAGRSTRLHVLPAGQRSAAGSPPPEGERRRSERAPADQTRWSDSARVKPGHEARVLDIGARGALIEAPTRLTVGARVEVCLVASDTGQRLELSGVIRRCFVAGLNPMSYRGAVEFDSEIELRVLDPFTVPETLTA